MKLEEQEFAAVLERLQRLKGLSKELEEADLSEVLTQATKHLARMHSAIHFVHA